MSNKLRLPRTIEVIFRTEVTMRLALTAALLIVCLCSQGCLSFFFYRSSPNAYATSKRTSSIVTGIIGGVLATAGGICVVDAVLVNRKPYSEEQSWNYSADIMAAGLFFLLSLPFDLLG